MNMFFSRMYIGFKIGFSDKIDHLKFNILLMFYFMKVLWICIFHVDLHLMARLACYSEKIFFEKVGVTFFIIFIRKNKVRNKILRVTPYERKSIFTKNQVQV